MSSKKKKLRKAAEEAQSTAAESAAAAVEQAVTFLTPYVEAARDSVGPAAKQAAERSVDLAHKAKETLEPRLHDAFDRVSPAVDQAKAKVQSDLVPKLTELLHEAEKHPAVKEANKRGAATLAAVKGELELPSKKRKRRVGRTIAKVIAAGALLAGAAVAVRQFLGNKDDGWTAHEPTAPKSETLLNNQSSAPVYTTETPAAESDAPESDASASSVNESTETASDGAVSYEPDVTVEGDALDQMVEEGSPVSAPEADGSEGASSEGGSSEGGSPHGAGSYIGETPPEGFAIKGNERSMKYHVPDSGGYDRTIADVWFESEDAAQAAGFTRAQR